MQRETQRECICVSVYVICVCMYAQVHVMTEYLCVDCNGRVRECGEDDGRVGRSMREHRQLFNNVKVR